MRKEILFASNNEHKVNEVRKLLPERYSVLSLNDIHWTEDIPEPFETYEENAKAKAYFVFDRTGMSCFADDSGLEVDSLHGRPGVLSARYAGETKNSEDNIERILAELGNNENRKARFQAVIVFIHDDGQIATFTGTVEGRINFKPVGSGGFGYDPIFIPEGFDETFGQLPESIKNKISHRAKAMQKFVEYLRGINS